MSTGHEWTRGSPSRWMHCKRPGCQWMFMSWSRNHKGPRYCAGRGLPSVAEPGPCGIEKEATPPPSLTRPQAFGLAYYQHADSQQSGPRPQKPNRRIQRTLAELGLIVTAGYSTATGGLVYKVTDAGRAVDVAKVLGADAPEPSTRRPPPAPPRSFSPAEVEAAILLAWPRDSDLSPAEFASRVRRQLEGGAVPVRRGWRTWVVEVSLHHRTGVEALGDTDAQRMLARFTPLTPEDEQAARILSGPRAEEDTALTQEHDWTGAKASRCARCDLLRYKAHVSGPWLYRRDDEEGRPGLPPCEWTDGERAASGGMS